MKTNKTARKYRSAIISKVLDETPPVERSKTEFKMTLAARLADFIKDKGWQKSEFADKLGKQPSEITKWLSGTHNFTTDTLIEISFLLEIHITELFAPKPLQVVKHIHIEVKGSAMQPQSHIWGHAVGSPVELVKATPGVFMTSDRVVGWAATGVQYYTKLAESKSQKQKESFT